MGKLDIGSVFSTGGDAIPPRKTILIAGVENDDDDDDNNPICAESQVGWRLLADCTRYAVGG